MDNKEEQHEECVRAAERGRLPLISPVRIWAGRGDGQPCAACGKNIEPTQTEYELDFGDGKSTISMHLECFFRWKFQIERNGES